jgi:hypothetical protein
LERIEHPSAIKEERRKKKKMILHYTAILVSSLSKEMLNFSVLMVIE